MIKISRVLAMLGCLAFAAARGLGAPAEGSGEIVVGMSTALTGAAANLGTDMRQGVLAGFERANRAGGVHGRKLRLIALDDGYEPARTAPNMRQLIEKDHVLALIGNVGTPTAIAAVPIANEQKTLLFASFTGAGVLRKRPPDRYVINYRASYAEETAEMVHGLVDIGELKVEDIAFFTQRDSYGDAGFSGGVEALRLRGLMDEKKVLHVRYERNTLAVENALASLLYAEHEPKAVIMVGAYGPCAKFIKLAREAGMKATFLNVSFVGSNSLAKELGNTSANVIVTQVVPHPLGTQVPVVREYLADIQAMDPAAKPGFGALEGYISARIFLKALERIPGEPTREGIVDALEKLGEFDVGLNEMLNYGPKAHQASHVVWATILKDGAFAPFDWNDVTHLFKDSMP